jgi:hypothetical protein
VGRAHDRPGGPGPRARAGGTPPGAAPLSGAGAATLARWCDMAATPISGIRAASAAPAPSSSVSTAGSARAASWWTALPERGRAPGRRPVPGVWAAGWRNGWIGCSKTATTGASPGKRPRRPPPLRPPSALRPCPNALGPCLPRLGAAAWRPSPAALPGQHHPGRPRPGPPRSPGRSLRPPPRQATGRRTAVSRCPAGNARRRAPLPLTTAPPKLPPHPRRGPGAPCPAPPGADPDARAAADYGGGSADRRLASWSR